MLFGDAKRLYNTIDYLKSRSNVKHHRNSPFTPPRTPNSKSVLNGLGYRERRVLGEERGIEKERTRLGGLDFRRGDVAGYGGEQLSPRGDRSPALLHQEENVDLSILYTSPTSSLRYSYDSKDLNMDHDLIGLISPRVNDLQDNEEDESDDMEDIDEIDEKDNFDEETEKKGTNTIHEIKKDDINIDISNETSVKFSKTQEQTETEKKNDENSNNDKGNKKEIHVDTNKAEEEEKTDTTVSKVDVSAPSKKYEFQIRKAEFLTKSDLNMYVPGARNGLETPISGLAKMITRKNASILSSKYRGTVISQHSMGYDRETDKIASREGKSHRRNTSVSTVVVVYLPNRKPIEVKVSEPCTVMELLLCILQYLRERRPPQADFSSLQDLTNPQAYELRLHDIGGEPEDFALDKRKDIKDFKEDGQSYEFCLKHNPIKRDEQTENGSQKKTNKYNDKIKQNSGYEGLANRKQQYELTRQRLTMNGNTQQVRDRVYNTQMDGFDSINEFDEDDDDEMDGLEGIGRNIVMKIFYPQNFIEYFDVTPTTTISELLQWFYFDIHASDLTPGVCTL